MGFVGSWINSAASAVKSAASEVGEAVKSAASAAVAEATEYIAKGIGKVVSDALTAIGLPRPLANIFAMALDPMYASRNLGQMIEDVGRELGLPEGLCKGLHKLLDKADELAKRAMMEGVGGVIRYAGKELGLPPALVDSIALAANLAMGNGAAVANDLTRLALMAAKELGVPPELVEVAQFGVAAYSGDARGMKESGAKLADKVLDRIDMPDELRAGFDIGLDVATGNTEAAKQHGAQLAMSVAGDILPDELAKGVRIGADLYRGDTAGAARELGIDEKYVKMGVSLGQDIAANGTQYLKEGKRLIDDKEHRNEVIGGLAKMGAEEGARFGARKLGVDERVVNAGIDVAKNHEKYLEDGKKILSDPEARKAALEKAEKVALEQGAHFAGNKLGVDPRYINVGLDVVKNRDAYLGEAQKLYEDPEYRKAQIEKGTQAVIDKAEQLGTEKLAKEIGVDKKVVQAGVNVVKNADEYIDKAGQVLTDKQVRQELVQEIKSEVKSRVDSELKKAEAELDKVLGKVEHEASQVADKLSNDLEQIKRPFIRG